MPDECLGYGEMNRGNGVYLSHSEKGVWRTLVETLDPGPSMLRYPLPHPREIVSRLFESRAYFRIRVTRSNWQTPVGRIGHHAVDVERQRARAVNRPGQMRSEEVSIYASRPGSRLRFSNDAAVSRTTGAFPWCLQMPCLPTHFTLDRFVIDRPTDQTSPSR